MELHNDRARLQAYRDGDPKVLDALYREHHKKLLRSLARGFMVKSGGRPVRLSADDPLDRMELVQETFTRAFSPRVRLSYTGLVPFFAFLARIARNLVIDRGRKRKRWDLIVVEDTTVGREIGSPTLTQTAAAPALALGAGESPESVASRAQMRRLVKGMLETLEADEQALLLHFHGGETSQRKVAEAMGLTRDQVRTLVARIRKKVLRYMYENGVIGQLDARTLMAAMAVMLLGGAA